MKRVWRWVNEQIKLIWVQSETQTGVQTVDGWIFLFRMKIGVKIFPFFTFMSSYCWLLNSVVKWSCRLRRLAVSMLASVDRDRTSTLLFLHSLDRQSVHPLKVLNTSYKRPLSTACSAQSPPAHHHVSIRTRLLISVLVVQFSIVCFLRVVPLHVMLQLQHVCSYRLSVSHSWCLCSRTRRKPVL